MKQFTKFLAVLLALSLMLSAFGGCGKKDVPAEEVPAETQTEISSETQAAETQAAEEQETSDGYYQIGDKMDDFTITTYDGREVSLYKVLEEKDMVLLNLWASWCGPCASEFPAMQEAYEQYQDKVEIIAISTYPDDTDEVLAEYAQEKGMTFCVAADKIGLDSRIKHIYIPTTIVVDRFGVICLQEENAVPDPAVFTNLFDIYTAEDYTESLFLTNIFAEKPTVQPADPAALKEALNGEGGTLEFTNSSNPFYWPMTVQQKDGRTVVAASNVNSESSKAVVETQVDVKAGDVLVMEYKLENEIPLNVLNVEVDGESIKKSALDQDWSTYAYQFEKAGKHQICVSFDVEMIADGYSSNLWIDSIRVVSGDEAAKALAANAKYPVAEKTQVQLLNENAKPVVVYDETAPDVKELVYICDDSDLQLLITLDETLDPENAYIEDGVGYIHPLALNVTEEGFAMEIPGTSAEDMVGFTTLYCNGEAYGGVTFFYSEETADQYLDLLHEYNGSSLKWEYADGSIEIQTVSGDSSYTVTYVDQNGDPVSGVMCQVCDESTCQVFTSDANGICQFTLPAKAYEIHTLKVPAGYEGDTTTITNAPVQGGELTFTLTKK